MIHTLADSDTYWSILTSPAHLLAEITVEVVSGVLVYPLWRRGRERWHAKHDKEAHGHG